MDKKYSIKISEEDENKRLDSFLSIFFEQKSRTQIQNSIKNGEILINSSIKKPSYQLKENDLICIDFKETENAIIIPENIPLDIKYEDDAMLVVNKSKNMLTHPTEKEKSQTLVNALLYKYGYKGLSNINGSLRPGILHRLDRNTSGLLMIAKNNNAHNHLANQIKEKTAIRKYLAIVQGTFQENEGTINKDISRHPTKPEKMSVVEQGLSAITHYKVLESFNKYTFLELKLETGRTHQIRVHLSSINHPIVNDSLYGAEKTKVKTKEQTLQAYDLTFTTPYDNSIINVHLEPDEDIQKVLKYLRSKQ